MAAVSELLRRCTEGWSPTQWLTTATWIFIAAFVAVEMLGIHSTAPDRPPVGTAAGPDLRATARREARTALGMVAGALVVGVAYGAVFAALWRSVGAFAPAGLVGFWQRHPVLTALCAFVAWDFSGWIYHVIGHRTRFGWAAHSAHHSGSLYNASLALRLTWMPWHGLLHHPLIALAGFPLEVILGCLAVSSAMQAVQHSSILPIAPRWLTAIVMTPEAHRLHHDPEGAETNLGPVFTVWDRFAGTWYRPDTDPAVRDPWIATPDSTTPGALRVQLAGWRRLIANTPLPSATPGGRRWSTHR
ncbi:MAG: sterol desaturase family protein [Microthrixaceae bacterium]|nr:sterol desaturase family protein [Microthrixaceae bacterium]